MHSQLLDQKTVCKHLQVTNRTIQRWIRDGNFPPPVRLSPRCLRWRVEDVETHLRQLQEGKS